MPYTLSRQPFPPAERRLVLGARRVLATATAGEDSEVERFIRLRLVEREPGELADFRAPGGGDHARFLVGSADGGPLETNRDGSLLVEGRTRTETVVAHDSRAGWLDLDVLVHGAAGAESGLMGAWAARAPLGSPIAMIGPKASVVLSGAPREVVLAGDDSALPAIRRYLRTLGSNVVGTLLVETRFSLAQLPIEVPAGVRVSILAPDPLRPSTALATALAAVSPPVDPAERFVFACGEQSLVAAARAQLASWGIESERAVVKGYWRRSTPVAPG